MGCESMARWQGGCQGGNSVWRYQAVNEVTGEVVELGADTPGERRWPQPRVQLFQRGIQRVAEEGIIGKEAWRVLGYLLGILDWDNWLVVPQGRVADALGMLQPQVSRAVRALIENNLLMQAGRPYPRSAYRLSSDFAYKGQYTGWQKRQREERSREKDKRR